MKAELLILGGGFVGQLIHTVFPHGTVLDWRAAPRNGETMVQNRSFGPQYLWQPLEGFDCTPFKIFTTVDGAFARPENVARYKAKVGKGHETDWGMQFETVTTGYDIAMPDVPVSYGHRATHIDVASRTVYFDGQPPRVYSRLFSTIPLYALFELLGHVDIAQDFSYAPIFVASGYDQRRPSNGSMWVDYRSQPADPVYRVTSRHGTMHEEALQPLAPRSCRRIIPGKLYPHAHVAAMHAVLASYNIFCFGRYATWDGDELAHQTYDKIRSWQAVVND
jgi:hypothetical protein